MNTVLKAPPTVAEYMTREVVALHPGDLVLLAREAMDVGDMRHLPIVDADNRLVGMISDRDVLAALATGERKTVVGAIMTHPVHTVTAACPAHEAIACMLSQKIGALAVVGSDGPYLVGIVTETDFLLVAERALGGSQ
jgi:CBS domain-containing protein